MATKLKCDIKLVGSATSRRKNSNYFLSLLFLRLLLLPSLLCASSVIFCPPFFFFFSFFIIIPSGQIFGVFHFYYRSSRRITLLSLQVVHTTRKTAFMAAGGSKELTLCRASTSNSFLQKGCSGVFFFFPAPTFYHLSSSARLHIHLYLQTHLFTGRETDSEERTAKKSVRL